MGLYWVNSPGHHGNTMKFHPILAVLLLCPGLALALDPPAPPATTEDATQAPPPPRNPPLRRETVRSKALAEQIQRLDRETEVVWLGSGDEAFLGLYQPDHSGKTFAHALILHDNQQHPDWPGLVKRLRRHLTDHGWNTLAIQLPDYLEEPVIPPETAPAQETPPEPAPEAAMPGTNKADPKKTETMPAEARMPGAKSAEPPLPEEPAAPPPPTSVEYPVDEVPDIVDKRVREAVAFLQKKTPAPVVIIAVGLSASITAKKARTMLLADIGGLVIIDPVDPASLDFKIDLDAMDLRIPVLDIAPEFSPRSNPRLRLDSARKLRHELYEQKILLGARPPFSGMEIPVEKAIRGWGDRNIKIP